MHFKIFTFIGFILLSAQVMSQVKLEEDFSIQLVNDQVSKPNALIFDENGDLLVWEKEGLIWRIIDGVKVDEPVLDIREEVMDIGDMGLVSAALDGRGYLYVYFIVDYHHLIYFGSNDYDSNKNTSNKATIGRVSRYRLEAGKAVPESREVLIGRTKENGIPVLHTSHVGGSLIFADDGSLFLSIGDCSTWEGNYVGDGPPYYNAKVEQALEDGIIRPEEEVGTMRAQMINSYSGKIIRFHPETGLGYPSNPYFDVENPDAPQSKVWALGFRNPYRMTLRKGSGKSDPILGIPGTLLVGEVGGSYWEELNVVTKKGLNFGWPLFEGNDKSELYDLIQTNKDVINPCDGKPMRFQDLIKQQSNKNIVFKNPCDTTLMLDEKVTFVHQPPALNLAHITAGLGVFTNTFDEDGNLLNIRIEDERSEVAGDIGMVRSNAVLAGSIYTGDKFPSDYKDDLFISDFNNGWIARVELDLNEEVQGIYKFYDDTFKIKHITEGPEDGCIYVVKANDRIEKICYDVNVPPVLELELDKNYGTSPVTVFFDASQSYDPEGDSLKFIWTFGDGEVLETNDRDTITHLYKSSTNEIENIAGKLLVLDRANQLASQDFFISLNNTPPIAEIKGLENNSNYSIAGLNLYDLSSEISDRESRDEEVEIEWTIYLHHNTHFHEEERHFEPDLHLEIPPVGCTDEIFYYRVKLEATDPQGLSTHNEIYIYPDCDNIFAKLNYFEGALIGEGIALEWDMDFEDGALDFAVERLGKDRFSEIATVDQGGEYQVIDRRPKIGTNTYRLRIDGPGATSVYSQEVRVIYAGDKEVYIYPNPANEEFNIYFSNLQGKADIEVLDMTGKVLISRELSGSGQTWHRIEEVASFPRGSYLLVLNFNSQRFVEKILIK